MKLSFLSNRQTQIPPPAVDGFDRVQHITALGVKLCHDFYMSEHIDTVITSCARILYGLRTLRAHGMPQASLQLIFRTTAPAKLLYATPVWWGFPNSGEINRLEEWRSFCEEPANQAITLAIL